MIPLAALGIDQRVLALTAVAALCADIYQHANIAIRLGPLSWIYFVGDAHRWHRPLEGARRSRHQLRQRVYLFWDAIFGTRYVPDDREPPTDAGIEGLEAFPDYFAQWASPSAGRRSWDASAARRAKASNPEASGGAIGRRLSRLPGRQSVDQDPAHAQAGLDRRAADVRHHEDVRQREVPLVDIGLPREDVEGRPANASGGEGLDQAVVVDDVALRDVHDQQIRAGVGEQLAVDAPRVSGVDGQTIISTSLSATRAGVSR